ncbi:MAG: hypothetical protein QOF51_898 [Chloroflexota bacterium]|jgi:hypothetical protein|nr:hypothetical protein [Chloroflexota bacterium]
MAFRIEWRSRAEGDDTILAIENGSNKVMKIWVADIDLLTDFLNDMAGLDAMAHPTSGNGVDHTQHAPQEWGDLVMARSETGDVLSVDPALYLGGISHWYRSQGRDPHPYHPSGQ